VSQHRHCNQTHRPARRQINVFTKKNQREKMGAVRLPSTPSHWLRVAPILQRRPVQSTRPSQPPLNTSLSAWRLWTSDRARAVRFSPCSRPSGAEVIPSSHATPGRRGGYCEFDMGIRAAWKLLLTKNAPDAGKPTRKRHRKYRRRLTREVVGTETNEPRRRNSAGCNCQLSLDLPFSKRRRNSASQLLTPATKSTNGVLSPRFNRPVDSDCQRVISFDDGCVCVE
jgi:hypothetical protein